jgi:hypothetical protein
MLLSGIAYALLALWKPSGSRITLVQPGVAAIQAGPIQTETDPNLAEEGYQCKYLSRSDAVDQIAFVRREIHAARIEIRATKTSLKGCEFFYILFDEDGQKLSEGRLTDVSSKDNENGVFELFDAGLAQTKRIVVYKR